MTDKDKAKTDLGLGLLEEDDEFEEFSAEGYADVSVETENMEISVWEDNWDDDNVEDDFNQQLRTQLEDKNMDVKK